MWWFVGILLLPNRSLVLPELKPFHRALMDSTLLFASSEIHLELKGVTSEMDSATNEAFIATTVPFLSNHLSSYKIQDFIVKVESQRIMLERRQRKLQESSALAVVVTITMEYQYEEGITLTGPISFHSELQDIFTQQSNELIASLQQTNIPLFLSIQAVLTTEFVESTQARSNSVHQTTTLEANNGVTFLSISVFVSLGIGLLLFCCLAICFIRRNKKRYIYCNQV